MKEDKEQLSEISAYPRPEPTMTSKFAGTKLLISNTSCQLSVIILSTLVMLTSSPVNTNFIICFQNDIAGIIN